MIQNIFVYIIVGLAVLGAVRITCQKLKAFKKNKSCDGCKSCPLKTDCTAEKEKNNSCCH